MMKMIHLKISFCFLLIVMIFSACSDKIEADYRKGFIGNYDGQEISSSHYLNSADSSLFETGQDTLLTRVAVTLADCEGCISIIYDTINFEIDMSILSDTISIPEDGIFEVDYDLIGNTYYRSYNVYFKGDSLLIQYFRRSTIDSYSYSFKGSKISK